MKNTMMRLWREEEGASAMEYAVLAAVVIAAVVAGLILFKPQLTALWNRMVGNAQQATTL